MDRRERMSCPICGRGNFLKLYNHLAQVHGLNATERQQYLTNGGGSTVIDNDNKDNDDDIFTESEEDTEDEMSDDDICSDDEYRMWLSLREAVVNQYNIDMELEKLRESNPNATENDLKRAIREKFKQRWINSAAKMIQFIISMSEFFQTDPYIAKILKIRQRLGDEEDDLTMAIDRYKSKLGKLFECPMEIPE